MRGTIAIRNGLCMSSLLVMMAMVGAETLPKRVDSNGPVEAELRESMKDAMKNPKDDPRLPRVLLIGDSISIGYTVPVRRYLAGKANVHRPPVNCRDTAYGLTNLKTWLGAEKWDVIHFNWGIWDTHYLDAKTGNILRYADEKIPERQARVRNTPEEYRRNLEKLTAILHSTGARLICASSTPIMFREGARFEDIAKYNRVAADVMRENGVEIDDLYAFTLSSAAQWQTPDQCHFNALGNARMGEKVGAAIATILDEGTQRRDDEKRMPLDRNSPGSVTVCR